MEYPLTVAVLMELQEIKSLDPLALAIASHILVSGQVSDEGFAASVAAIKKVFEESDK